MLKPLVFISLSFGLVASCSKAPTRANFGKGGADGKVDSGNLPKAEVPDGVKKDPFKEPEKLSLSSMKSDEEGAKTFDFSKPVELHWISAHEAIFSHNDGESLSYDFQAKAWSAIHVSDLRTEYQSMFDFRDAGFFAGNGNVLSLRSNAGKIIQLNAPEDFDEKGIVGANPGFVAYKSGDDVKILLSKDDGARLYPMENAPKGLKLVYPCNLHCIVWGFDGSRISVFFEGDGWKLLDQVIELPAGEDVSRMAIRFRAENNPVAAEGIIVQTVKGGIFAQVASSAPKAEITWEDVQTMSQHYCVSCHLEDGYDKEATWTGLKSSIVERLTAKPGTKGAMPPIETKIGQQMSAGERAAVLSWIEKQTQTDRGEVGTGGSGDTDNVKISGALKSLAEANCNSCHADATTNGWWKSRKGAVISQVNSGKMPKNKTLSSDVKAQFEAAMNALK